MSHHNLEMSLVLNMMLLGSLSLRKAGWCCATRKFPSARSENLMLDFFLPFSGSTTGRQVRFPGGSATGSRGTGLEAFPTARNSNECLMVRMTGVAVTEVLGSLRVGHVSGVVLDSGFAVA
ncbi:hypothetical protein B0H65DRAFT_437652 [Neurospora tetraspora]|uniref:Secreted protein n=1 Tax=Neurospora tetraspora TaxID=94610 RepID=A0AAE0MVZ5_9PEZI|nr:hypothetical protein B0H65DRAFT_437652 [Neurospora tetraspora]